MCDWAIIGDDNQTKYGACQQSSELLVINIPAANLTLTNSPTLDLLCACCAVLGRLLQRQRCRKRSKDALTEFSRSKFDTSKHFVEFEISDLTIITMQANTARVLRLRVYQVSSQCKSHREFVAVCVSKTHAVFAD